MAEPQASADISSEALTNSDSIVVVNTDPNENSPLESPLQSDVSDLAEEGAKPSTNRPLDSDPQTFSGSPAELGEAPTTDSPLQSELRTDSSSPAETKAAPTLSPPLYVASGPASIICRSPGGLHHYLTPAVMEMSHAVFDCIYRKIHLVSRVYKSDRTQIRYIEIVRGVLCMMYFLRTTIYYTLILKCFLTDARTVAAYLMTLLAPRRKLLKIDDEAQRLLFVIETLAITAEVCIQSEKRQSVTGTHKFIHDYWCHVVELVGMPCFFRDDQLEKLSNYCEIRFDESYDYILNLYTLNPHGDLFAVYRDRELEYHGFVTYFIMVYLCKEDFTFSMDMPYVEEYTVESEAACSSKTNLNLIREKVVQVRYIHVRTYFNGMFWYSVNEFLELPLDMVTSELQCGTYLVTGAIEELPGVIAGSVSSDNLKKNIIPDEDITKPISLFHIPDRFIGDNLQDFLNNHQETANASEQSSPSNEDIPTIFIQPSDFFIGYAHPSEHFTQAADQPSTSSPNPKTFKSKFTHTMPVGQPSTSSNSHEMSRKNLSLTAAMLQIIKPQIGSLADFVEQMNHIERLRVPVFRVPTITIKSEVPNETVLRPRRRPGEKWDRTKSYVQNIAERLERRRLGLEPPGRRAREQPGSSSGQPGSSSGQPVTKSKKKRDKKKAAKKRELEESKM